MGQPLNLFAWSVSTGRLIVSDSALLISSFADGDQGPDYFLPENEYNGWNFRKNSCVWAGGGAKRYPHLKNVNRGDIVIVRKGNQLQPQAQRVHAVAIAWRNNYQNNRAVEQGEDVVYVIYITVKDVEPHKYDIKFQPKAVLPYQGGIPFYSNTETLLQNIRNKQNGGSGKEPVKHKYLEEIALLKANKNLVLTGPPGTGKTYIAKKLAQYFLGVLEDDLPEDTRYAFVQFHPSYDYTDFIEGLRPVKQEEQKDIGFELVADTFKKFCIKAVADRGIPYVFIIDEINRGEISKIFGELFFSIESDYRGKKGALKTQYHNLHTDNDHADDDMGDQFYVPENVYIIGTMNDIDRSVEGIDFAMRRRFAWKRIDYKDTIGMLDDTLGDDADVARSRLTNLNEAIAPKDSKSDGGIDGLNADYHIGAAYMLKVRDYHEYTDDEKWQRLWKYHLEPLLREYLRGKPHAEESLKTLKTAYDGKATET